MADFQDILYDKHQRVRGAAWITINRPQAMNSFTGDTLTEMAQAMDDASSDPEIGVIVITGAGDRAFCPGGDVRWQRLLDRRRQPPGLLLRLHDRLRKRDVHAGRPACRQPRLGLHRREPHARGRREEGKGDVDDLPALQRKGGAGDGPRQHGRRSRGA